MEPPDGNKQILLHRLHLYRQVGYTIDFNENMTEEALLAIHNIVSAEHQKQKQKTQERMALRFAIIQGEATGQIDSDQAVKMILSRPSNEDLQDFIDQ